MVTPRRVKISQKSYAPPTQVPTVKLFRDIRGAIRKYHSAEGKIHIVLEGVRGKESIGGWLRTSPR
jgi:hypothetical protein